MTANHQSNGAHDGVDPGRIGYLLADGLVALGKEEEGIHAHLHEKPEAKHSTRGA